MSAQLSATTHQQLRAIAFKTGDRMTAILARLVSAEHARLEKREGKRS